MFTIITTTMNKYEYKHIIIITTFITNNSHNSKPPCGRRSRAACLTMGNNTDYL